VVQIHEEQCLSNWKTQTPPPWFLTDSSVLFFWLRRVLPVCVVKQLKCLYKIFTKFAAKFHTHKCFSSCYIVTNLTNSLCTCPVQWM
jgi:hypothetical protein